MNKGDWCHTPYTVRFGIWRPVYVRGKLKKRQTEVFNMVLPLGLEDQDMDLDWRVGWIIEEAVVGLFMGWKWRKVGIIYHSIHEPDGTFVHGSLDLIHTVKVAVIQPDQGKEDWYQQPVFALAEDVRSLE